MTASYGFMPIMREYLEHGSVETISASYLTPPRGPVPRDREGRLAYWTDARSDHLASWRLWSAAEACVRLYKIHLQIGREEEAASDLASSVCLACNASLVFLCGNESEWLADGGDGLILTEDMRVPQIGDLSRVSWIAPVLADLPSDPAARRSLADRVPDDVLAVCLMAGAPDSLDAAAGSEEAKRRIYRRLFTPV